MCVCVRALVRMCVRVSVRARVYACEGERRCESMMAHVLCVRGRRETPNFVADLETSAPFARHHRATQVCTTPSHAPPVLNRVDVRWVHRASVHLDQRLSRFGHWHWMFMHDVAVHVSTRVMGPVWISATGTGNEGGACSHSVDLGHWHWQ